ncbi:MAG: ATP-dependent DNA helicase [Mobilicoccus sp.]|nr:ATP-dependent DNA helicase [Mobilicoccus sp.]
MSVYSAAEVADALSLPPPTAEQAAVIGAPLTSMLVVAGAGSGKTETMAGRVVWLVANDLVPPESVLGLTFTRKAAGELAERIVSRLQMLSTTRLWEGRPPIETDAVPTVATYHSYAGGIVREHGLRLGVEPDARLLTEAAAWQYAHEVVMRYDGPMEAVPNVESTVTGAVRDLAGGLAEHLRTPDDLDDHLAEIERRVRALPRGSGRGGAVPGPVKAMLAQVAAQRQVVPILRAYAATKAAHESLDFADQMAHAATLAGLDPQVGRTERARYRIVLLDEFQDTSEAQMRLLHALYADERSGPARPVTAVGDPHQSIYGWRGASATTLATFPERFTVDAVSVGDIEDAAETTQGPVVPGVLTLSRSWRNDRVVLAAANLVAAPLTAGSAVPVRALQARDGAEDGLVEAARLLTAQEEAAYVADWIADSWFDASGEGHTGVSAAVLCRRRAQFAAVADALAARNLPVEVVGLGGLLTRPEVSDIVSLLRVVHDPSRGDALMRLLTGPFVRLGAADLDALGAWSRELQRARATPDDEAEVDDDEPSIVEAVDTLPAPEWEGSSGERFSPVAHARLTRLGEAMSTVRVAVGQPLPDLVVLAERTLGLDVEVASGLDTLPATARAQLDAFADAAADFTHAADRPSLGGFLAWLDAAREEERGLDSPATAVAEGAVQVLTVHAAKGLEWDVVAVPGLIEAAFPSHRSFTPPKDGGLPRPTSKGWLTGLGSVPYDLRGDREGLPRLPWRTVEDLTELKRAIEEFSADGGDHLIAEERRLAYVAFTRARHRMLLSASVWADGTRPRTPSRFLSELVDASVVRVRAWEPDPPEGSENPSALGLDAVWPPHRDDLRDRTVALAAQWVRDAGPPPPPSPGMAELGSLTDLLLAEWSRPRDSRIVARLPGHLSTSAVVELYDDPAAVAERLRRPMPAPPATAARVGTAFHTWIEQHYRQASLVDDTDLGYVDEEGDLLDLQEAKRLFLASPWASQTPLEVEVSLETVVAGLPIRGRIDAVFPRPGGGVVVVDWKTGRPPTGDRLRRRALQLAVYRLAYARWSGLPADDIDAAFYYAATGETVHPPLPNEDELIGLIADLTAAD